MPGFLSEYDDTEHLTFGADKQWWVDVKKHLVRGEFRKAQTLLVKPVMTYVGTNAETKGDVDTVTYQDEIVFAGVVDWNLTDRDGNPLPLAPDEAKRASISLLPEEIFEEISKVVRTGQAKPDAKNGEAGPDLPDPFPVVGQRRSHGSGTRTAGAD